MSTTINQGSYIDLTNSIYNLDDPFFLVEQTKESTVWLARSAPDLEKAQELEETGLIIVPQDTVLGQRIRSEVRLTALQRRQNRHQSLIDLMRNNLAAAIRRLDRLEGDRS